MSIYWVAALSFLITFFVTPQIIKLAKKFSIIDDPKRTHPAILHKKPIPRGGGAAIFISIFLSYFFLSFFNPNLIDKHIIGVFLGAILVVIVGILDDKYDLNPYLRLGSNFLAVAIVVAFGVGITWIANPLGGQIHFDEIIFRFSLPEGWLFGGPHSVILFADIFAFLWIAWLMNAMNWSSGVDGQLSGVAAIATITLGFVAIKYLATDPNQVPLATLAFITAGSYMGFLPWSFYPQKIMPGYSGGALAGFLIGVLSILAGGKLAVAAIVLAVPLVDGTWAISRRLFKRTSPVWGDKGHLHHQLLALGWKIPQIALFYYAVTIVLSIFALSLDGRGKFFAIIMIFILLFSGLATIAALLNKIRFKHEF
jgi:UDP-GlcNAc:undecaprenyl-phosphate GlcNAc-1-phosphate transferase